MTDIIKFQGANLPKVNIGAFTQQLQQARDQVSVSTGTPFLKLGKEDGVWVYGQEDTEIEEGSLWAVNPMSMMTGVIAWPPAKSPLKEPIKKMRAVFDTNSPIISRTSLAEPTNGGVWDDCISFQMQCIGGVDEKGNDIKVEDIDVVIEYQQNSHGGKQAFDELAKALMVQASTDPNLIVPVCLLESESYEHPKWGTVYKPLFTIVKWLGMDGAAAAPPAETNGAGPRQQQPANEPPPPPPADKPAGRGGRRGAAAGATAQPGAAPAETAGVVRRRRRAS